MDVLRYAASICRDAYERGTAESGLLELFAESEEGQPCPASTTGVMYVSGRH
jgi:hypothetical protein